MASVVRSSYNPFKDIWLYMKHRIRHIKDLNDNFYRLRLRYSMLLASEKNLEETLKFRRQNEKYDTLKKQVKEIGRKYKDIESKFNKSGGQGSQSQPTDENGVTGGEDVPSTSSDQVAENAHTGRRKIWTRKFFDNARLDKDVLNLIKEIDDVKVDQQKLETLEIQETRVQWTARKAKDDMPPHWQYVDKILGYLGNESIKRIGICGAPQVGKSTVLSTLNNYFDPEFRSSISHSSMHDYNLQYDIVIWVPYPLKEPEKAKETIQLEILRRICGNGDQRSLEQNAAKIHDALAKVKYLLILDDVYEEIDLAVLGIDHQYGKVVIGAAGEYVVRLMGVDEIILIENLKPDAAETFLKQCLGLESRDHWVQLYIMRVVELVGGHIGSLFGVAQFVKGLGAISDLIVWETVVHELQSPNSLENLGLGVVEKAYKLCYDALKMKNLKKCILYIALFPLGYHVPTSYLVECWKAEKFLDGCPTLKDARAQGVLVIKKLTSMYSLLELHPDEDHVKMSLIFKKVALQIPYPDEQDGRLLVWNVLDSRSHPAEVDWVESTRISLMYGNLNLLPDSPMCKHTLTLLLQGNPTLSAIKESFFTHMGGLLVLDLQGTGINALPLSISALTHLRCLYLNDCSGLQSLPTEMKELKQLELLDIRRTGMICLCPKIYLKTLRCLRISVYSLESNINSSTENGNLSQQEPLEFLSQEFFELQILEELTIHINRNKPNWRWIVEQIKKQMKEEHKHLIVRWELEGSYFYNTLDEPSNNVVANGSRPDDYTASGSQSNGQSHSSEIQPENTGQQTESTKVWVCRRFHS